MQKNVSPEEKLLSIIKGKQNKPDDAGAGKPEVPKDNIPALTVRNKIDDYILTILKTNFLKNNLLDPRLLKIFNRYAVIVLAIIMVYGVLDLILVNPSRKADLIISRASVSRQVMPLGEREKPIETKNYSHYSGKITGKNIFTGSNYGQTELQGAAAPSESDVGLVGIIPGANPQAIIEDKKSQKTYYIAKGQSANEITVEDINENKVLLDYKGKKIALFL